MASQIIRKQVSIIGGGPVGQTAAYLLEKAGISYSLIEKQTKIMQHPAAHLINLRSMEIYKECGLEDKILEQTENINNFRYYRYMKRLLDKSENQFAVHDHFYPSPDHKQREINTQTFSNYVHLPQCKLSEVLYENNTIKDENYHLGCQVESISNPKLTTDENSGQNFVELNVKNLISGQDQIFQSDYLIACDGFHSFIRKHQGIQMIGQQNIQSFLNIYFHSKKLADLLDEKNQNAMLHFLYNSDIIACLVNHTKKSGMFVLQIPIYPPFSNLVDLDYSKDPQIRESQSRRIINQLIAKEYQLSDEDINIKNVGMWGLSAVQIEKYFKNRIIFAGDSAHSFPPAGGFGMNTGIQEVHNLVHKFKIMFDPKYKNDSQKQVEILQQYHKERQQYCSNIINETMIEYRKSIEVAKKLGLSLNNLNIAKNFFKRLPLPLSTTQNLWGKLMKVGTLHLELDHNKFKRQTNMDYIKNTENLIPMMFYNHDVNYGYSHGFIQEEKKDYNKLIGQLMPHFYIKLNEQFNERTLSTREIPQFLVQNKYLDNLQQIQQQIIYQENLNPEYNTFFMVALYFDEQWQNKDNMQKIVNQMQFKPNFVLGVQLIQENQEQHKSEQQNVLQSYNHDLYCEKSNNYNNQNVLNEQQIEEYDKLLEDKIKEVFVQGNEMVLMRSDGHIYSIYDIQELQYI